MRQQLSQALKDALKTKDSVKASTLRLILAALKDRDISVREKGNYDGIQDADIEAMLLSMVKQRQESIVMYEKGGRPDLAEQERQEITIIQEFLPQQMSVEEIEKIVLQFMAELAITNLKDMGRIMNLLREQYGARMDMAVASQIVKKCLDV